MGLTSDLTYLHMNAGTSIDKIERGLHRWSREPGEPERTQRVIGELAAEAVRLRRDLDQFFERERRELVPRVRRIFGSEVREVRSLVRYQGRVLSALDRFIVTLTDDEARETASPQVHIAHLKRLFGQFVEQYDERCDADRNFYQMYSTVLYPGGLATE